MSETNTEFLLKEIKKLIIDAKINEVDSCIRLPSTDINMYIFYNANSDVVTQVTLDRFDVRICDYKFTDNYFSIVSTNTANKFLCINWVTDELTVLKYKLDAIGIIDYKLNSIYHDPENNEELVHELLFKDEADSATFSMYFSKLLNNKPDEYLLQTIKEKKLI